MTINVTLRKSVFVGLGTTGTLICEGISKLYEEFYGPGGVPELTRFVVIDTEDPLNCKTEGNWIRLAINSSSHRDKLLKIFDATKEQNNNNSNSAEPPAGVGRGDWEFVKKLEKWADRDLISGLAEHGGGGVRGLGRLHMWCAMHYGAGNMRTDNVDNNLRATVGDVNGGSNNKVDIEERLARWLGDEVSATIPDGVRAYLVGTLSGGTCSGTFLDIAHLIRRITNPTPDVYGTFSVPGMAGIDNANMQAASLSATAALIEYGKVRGKQIPGDGTVEVFLPTFERAFTTPKDPFKSFFVVSLDSANENHPPFTRDGFGTLNSTIVSRTFLAATSDLDDKVGACRVDIAAAAEKALAEADKLNELCQFDTFGIHRIRYPEDAIRRAASCEICTKAIEFLTSESVDNVLVGGVNTDDLMTDIKKAVADSFVVFLTQKKFSVAMATEFADKAVKSLGDPNNPSKGYEALDRLFSFVHDSYKTDKGGGDVQSFFNVDSDRGLGRELSDCYLQQYKDYGKVLVPVILDLLRKYRVSELKELVSNIVEAVKHIASSLPEKPDNSFLRPKSIAPNAWSTWILGRADAADFEMKQQVCNWFRYEMERKAEALKAEFGVKLFVGTVSKMPEMLEHVQEVKTQLEKWQQICASAIKEMRAMTSRTGDISFVSLGDSQQLVNTIGDDIDSLVDSLLKVKSADVDFRNPEMALLCRLESIVNNPRLAGSVGIGDSKGKKGLDLLVSLVSLGSEPMRQILEIAYWERFAGEFGNRRIIGKDLFGKKHADVSEWIKKSALIYIQKSMPLMSLDMHKAESIVFASSDHYLVMADDVSDEDKNSIKEIFDKAFNGNENIAPNGHRDFHQDILRIPVRNEIFVVTHNLRFALEWVSWFGRAKDKLRAAEKIKPSVTRFCCSDLVGGKVQL